MSNKMGKGLILGTIAGVIGGLLFAPKSGKETRTELKYKLDKATADMEGKTTEALEVAEEKFEEVKDKAPEVTEEFKTSADEFQKRALNAAAAAKKGFNKKV